MGFLFGPCLVINALLSVLSSFAVILLRKREIVSCFTFIVFMLSCGCLCSVSLPHDSMGWSAVSDCGIT